ncbi:PREDICTED: uncharacterized protein LOC109587651 [Amphimedon queenslandica]|uniref:LRAT domain-containing protein n=1 Tax=Amphimedon queenslandica TaxID=400682 RepID=A0A1X7TIT5_AMPQE|nr:PREDICTED: uncharacterized protein LOC109587651 [Amphimedon queenslandica]|eukprot:XP_019859430.1 PREDICTED: uncharacterized protein LOC109587651 [Amphimedon queenslandica]
MAEADDSASRVGYVFHSINEKDLKPGDQIYCHRLIDTYSHHGIYIGELDCEVIHFGGDDSGSLGKKIGQQDDETMRLVTALSLELEQLPEDSERAQEIKQQLDEIHKSHNRPVCIRSTTLAKFMNRNTLRLVSYGSSVLKKGFAFYNSAIHIVKAMPPSETVKLAKHFLNHPAEWGNYHLKDNNCEMFACFCKTGIMDLATQLNLRRLFFSERIMEPSLCKTFEEALRKYREQCIKN